MGPERQVAGFAGLILLGEAREAVPIYGSGSFTTYSIGRLKEQLGNWASQGMRWVKMKVGTDPSLDLDRVKAAISAIGEAELFVDANGAYSRKEALSFAEGFSSLGVVYFEEPVSSDDLEGLRLIRDQAPDGMKIAAGEYGYDLFYFRHMLEAGATDVQQADATRCLGLTGFLQADVLCAVFRGRSRYTARQLCISMRPSQPARSGTRNGSTITFASSTCSSMARPFRRTASSAPISAAPVSASNSNTKTHGNTPCDRGTIMSVSVQGFTVDPHTIRDQETQRPKPWTSIISATKADGLAKELKARVEGEVRFDDMSRALYSTDASNYRQVPIGVVIPKTIDDVVRTIACRRQYGAPFLSRGGGTSLCGQSLQRRRHGRLLEISEPHHRDRLR